MTRSTILLVLLALAPVAIGADPATAAPDADVLRVGAAAEVITPPAGAPMVGGYSPRAMEGVHDDLYAKAIVIDQDGVKVALVVCDLLGMPRPVAEAARALIAADPGIPAGHVMISGTHTHTGPIVPNNSARDPAEGEAAADKANAYAAALPELIARSVRAADAKLAPARVRTATGHEDKLSFNRRYVMADGTVAWNPGKLNPQIVRPAGPIDPALPVVSFEAVDGGRPLATYVNFAMHLDTTGGRQISADFPHALADVLGRVKGPDMLTVFATGACGDVNHLDVSVPEPQSSPAEARRIGTMLAGEVVKATARLRPIAPGPLRAASTVVPLPLPELKPGEFERAREVFLKVGKERTAFIDRVQAFKVLDVAARKGKPLEAEVQVVALGDDLAWVALPGEMFVELGLAVKERSPFRQTIVVELANGYLGYVPTRRAYAEGAYEVVSARCAEGSGELLADTAVRLLHELKPTPAAPAAAPATAPATTRAAAVTLPPKSQLHLYLMMGQSNMAGRGAIGEEDRTPHPRVLMFTADGQWEPAVEPITRDRKSGLGVGPGLAFGKVLAERDPKVTIGLIPCAVGGTPLSRWQKGGDLYANAVRRAKLASEVGTLKGVIWHQGENDAAEEERAKSYGDRLAGAVRDLRSDFGAPELPFVAAQLGEFLYTRTGNKSPFARTVNDALAGLPASLPHSAYVRSNGLGHKGDELHFDAAAERELGRRFAAEMLRLQRGRE